MRLLKAVGEVIPYIIKWVVMVYSSFCDYLGISEWLPITIAIMVIAVITGTKFYKTHY